MRRTGKQALYLAGFLVVLFAWAPAEGLAGYRRGGGSGATPPNVGARCRVSENLDQQGQRPPFIVRSAADYGPSSTLGAK
ncbi:MAG: hypothetical protein HY812_05915 [Planctomycetes bacterium]|nr:hypothetical protein [Planctomycetota bacterium]